MSKKTGTKARIVDAALTQSVSCGLVGLSFGRLAESTGLSKSGLFAHFNSKEALQKTVLERAFDLFMRDVVAPAQAVPAGLERLEAYFMNYLDWIGGEEQRPGCPFVMFVQEFDDRSGEVRDLLCAAQTAWRTLLSDEVRQAGESGNLRRDDAPEQIAFELIGAALSYQTALKLLGDRQARRKALTAYGRIVGEQRAGSP